MVSLVVCRATMSIAFTKKKKKKENSIKKKKINNNKKKNKTVDQLNFMSHL